MPKSDKKLNLLCWQGYEHSTITRPFIEQHGIDLNVQSLLSDAYAANQLIKGDFVNWDVLNINNAWVRDFLYPNDLVQILDIEDFPEYLRGIHKSYSDFLIWSFNSSQQLIGIGQRFGPFNMVINDKSISKVSAQQQGFNLANDVANKNRFGILDYPDFNVFHVCIGSGLNPFQKLTAEELERFQKTAERWFGQAALITDDHHLLNKKLIEGEIDFYISGGVYTASAARAQGFSNILSITPRSGPIDGKGGIAFSEITSVIKNGSAQPYAKQFLHYMLQPETAKDIAMFHGTCNPVAQMGDPNVFKLFSTSELDVIQWQDLEEDMSHCAHYQIPPNNAQLMAILGRTKIKYAQ